MITITPTRLHHLALTVTDVDASVRWYEDVFGVTFRMDAPHEGGVGKLLADDDVRAGDRAAPPRHERRWPLQRDDQRPRPRRLRRARPAPTSRPGRTTSRRNGVVRADTADKPLTQSPIADEPYGSVLVFRDPDNIQLELFCPAAA